MAFETNIFDPMLDEAVSLAVVASLHTATPDASGSNEVSGGSYARQDITWGSASSGSVASTSIPVFDVPSSTTVTHIGLWDTAETTFYGSVALSPEEVFGASGQLTVDPLTLTLSNS